MAAVAVADVDGLGVVGERLESFAADVLAAAMHRPAQMVNGGLYLRDCWRRVAQSLELLVARLGGEADYQSVQQSWLIARGIRGSLCVLSQNAWRR